MEWCTTCSCSFSAYTAQKANFPKLCFDTVTTHNDQPSYVKHVLGSIFVFFTPFGDWVWGGGGSPNGVVHNLLVQFFSLYSSKIKVSKAHLFDTVIT